MPAEVTTVRLRPELARRAQRVAATTGKSTSQLVHEAIELLLHKRERAIALAKYLTSLWSLPMLTLGGTLSSGAAASFARLR